MLKCIDCQRECVGTRCKSCSNRYNARNYPLNTIDKLSFTARDASGIALPVKMKFSYDCVKCDHPYNAALEFERDKNTRGIVSHVRSHLNELKQSTEQST